MRRMACGKSDCRRARGDDRVKAGWIFLLLGALLAGAEGPRISYSREMKGAYPPYVHIVVDRAGNVVYRESENDANDVPLEFRLRRVETDAIFDLAAKLDYFQKPLESNLKVANMGLKTFRWEDGETTHEQQFNFSKNADARLLADWFSRITATERLFLNLERTTRFDKLGINKVLLQMQVAVDRKRLVGGGQFLPLLDKVVRDESFLNMARRRAGELADYLRGKSEDGK